MPRIEGLIIPGIKNNEFCKMEIRHTLGRKNLLSDFPFSNSKSLLRNYLRLSFKKIKKTISLNNICLISILQKL